MASSSESEDWLIELETASKVREAMMSWDISHGVDVGTFSGLATCPLKSGRRGRHIGDHLNYVRESFARVDRE
jgi:hypothetical protein